MHEDYSAVKNLQLEMNNDVPLRDEVFNTLRRAILNGELLPGKRLVEAALANRLGVSRTPVREAIKRLESEGLVRIIDRKGAEVAGITGEQLRDVLEVRLALEELAGELACKRMNQKNLVQLKKMNEKFVKMINDESTSAFEIAKADAQFHSVIYDATNNKRLIQMVKDFSQQMYRYRLEHIKELEDRQVLVREHESIIAAISARDVAMAREAIREHISMQEKAIVSKLKER
ncbi:MAG: GntR family transcriptional regulator [Lachnospiraceae bacterium]|nr:GntR family transcriptional regulator [Lachnospiraceae bacterium]